MTFFTTRPVPPVVKGAAICLALAVLVWLVFGQTQTFDFVNYDDGPNLSENADVQRGLSLAGLVWAFTHSQVGHWDPLTTLSHMAVCHWFGEIAGPHHVANVLLHALGSVLLFLVLWRMTSAVWRSAFVAATFAIHPLRVESVAWVTERKDVLSGVFFFLTLGAYLLYTRRPQSIARYTGVIVLFALGLLCKSMLVTLPFLLLLLDYWPLGRFAKAPPFFTTFRALLREKIPLFVLSALCAIIQLIANREGLLTVERIPLSSRFANAIVSYADYLGQMLWPVRLVVFYPHPEGTLPSTRVALSCVLLLAISAAAWFLRRKHPSILVGWLWYLGILVPVIGLVQSGELARADRYTYLPQIGLYLGITWAVADLCGRLPHRNLLLGALSGAITIGLAWGAYRQTSYWRDSETLWNHALACNPGNYLAEENLAGALEKKGRVEEAIAHRERAISINPKYEISHNNLGLHLLAAGRTAEAITHFQKAVALKNRYAIGHNNLANALAKAGQMDEAIEHYKRALEIKPDYAEAEANLGNAFFSTGRSANAIFHYEKAVEIAPDYAKAHCNLGIALLSTGRGREALTEFEKALAIQPDYQIVQNNLAWVLATEPDATLRDGPRAVALAQQASNAAGGKNAAFLRTLAVAYAETGRFAEAVQTVQNAIQAVGTRGNAVFIESLRAELKLYQAGLRYDEGKDAQETELNPARVLDSPLLLETPDAASSSRAP